MKTCPSCGQTIDDNSRTTCPACYSPLNLPAARYTQWTPKPTDDATDTIETAARWLTIACIIPLIGGIAAFPLIVLSIILLARDRTTVGLTGLLTGSFMPVVNTAIVTIWYIAEIGKAAAEFEKAMQKLSGSFPH